MSTRFLEKLCRRAFGGESPVRVLQNKRSIALHHKKTWTKKMIHPTSHIKHRYYYNKAMEGDASESKDSSTDTSQIALATLTRISKL